MDEEKYKYYTEWLHRYKTTAIGVVEHMCQHAQLVTDAMFIASNSRWKRGDTFAYPLKDGHWILCQVLSITISTPLQLDVGGFWVRLHVLEATNPSCFGRFATIWSNRIKNALPATTLEGITDKPIHTNPAQADAL